MKSGDDLADTATEIFRIARDEPIGAVARIQDVLRQMQDAEHLRSNLAGKVEGYTPQSDAKVALVNGFKADEERLLRRLDWLAGEDIAADEKHELMPYDRRWLAIARTHFQEGYMALNRAVFQPQRIRLPEDEQ